MKKITALLLFLCSFTLIYGQGLMPAGSSNYDLINLKRIVSLDIPLKADPALKNLRLAAAHPDFVQLGTNNLKQFANGITIDLVKNPALKLNIAINTDSLCFPGTYQVNIPYVSDASSGFLVLNLVRNPAVIETPNNVSITNDPPQKDVVELHETGQKTYVSDLSFSYTLPGFNQTGLLVWDKGVNLLGAGERKRFGYHLNPDVFKQLPLGTTTGKLTAGSRFFSNSVSMTFTVTRKLPKFWIIVMVLAGLIVGFAVKQVLAVQAVNEGIRLSGYQLIADMLAFSDAIHDDTTQDTIKELVQKVNLIIVNANVIVSPAPSTALADLQTLRGTFNTIQQTFQNNIEAQKILLNNLNAALNDTSLYPTVQQYLANAVSLLLPAKTLIDQNNLQDAIAAVQKINNTASNGINDYKTYFTSVATFLTATFTYPAKAVQTIATIQPAINAMMANLNLVLYDPSNPGLAISKINDNQRMFLDIPDTLKTNIDADYKQDKGADAPTVFNVALQQWLDVIQQMIINSSDEPNAGLYSISLEFTALVSAWDEANVSASDESLIAEYVAYGSRDALSEVEPSATLVYKNQNFTESSIQQSLSRSKSRFLFLSLLQSFILMILIGAGAYSSLQATFVGYPTEFISIFLLAFSLDITVSTVGQFKAKTQ